MEIIVRPIHVGCGCSRIRVRVDVEKASDSIVRRQTVLAC